MNEQNDALSFAARIDNSRLITDGEATKRALRGIGETGEKQGTLIQRTFQNASSSIGLMAVGAVGSIGLLGRSILDVTAKFEKFGIVLKNTLGEAKGGEALSMIADFAATTPFQLDEVTGAFIKMANQGFVPTREELIKLGDLASSTGKSFDQLAEAILDAQTGEMERLKEFGIKASVAGDNVTFSFKEQKTTVDNSAASIRAYVLSLGELNGVAGANAKISESLTGQISNFGDKMDAMYNKIGSDNKGLLYGVVGTASTLVENYEKVGTVIGGLITVFGAYKLAVMYVAYEQKILAATNALVAESNGFLVESEARAIVMKQRSIAAQEALNKSMLANPYVLAAMAVAALGYALFKLVTHQTELEKAIQKSNLEIAKEETNAARLFAELNHAKEGTEGWKKAKDAILSQWGSYLTDQQKELLGTKNQAEAQKAVNDGLRENIALKTRKESLDRIEDSYGSQLEKYKSDLNDQITKKLGIQRAADVAQEIAPLIQNVKIAITDDEKANAQKELKDFSDKLWKELYGDQWIKNDNLLGIQYALRGYVKEVEATNKAFTANLKGNVVGAQIPDLKNYSEQREEIEKQLAVEKKKLEELKLANFDKLAQSKRNEISQLEELLKTTNSEILKSDLDKANAELAAIIKQGENPLKAVEGQEAAIKALEDKLGLHDKQKKAVDELKTAQEAFEAAIKSGDQAAISAASNRVNQLEKEKKLIQDTIDLELQKAWRRQFDGQPMAEMPTIGPKSIVQVGSQKTAIDQKGKKIIYEVTAIDKTGPVWKKLGLETDRLKKQADEGAKDSAEMQKKLNKEIHDHRIDNQNQILDGAVYFTRELSHQLDLTQQEAEAFNGVVDIAANLFSGNFIAAGVSALTMLTGAIFGGQKESPQLSTLERINEVLKQQSAILSNLAGGNYFLLAEKQLRDYQAQINNTAKSLKADFSSTTMGQLVGGRQAGESLQQYNARLSVMSSRINNIKDGATGLSSILFMWQEGSLKLTTDQVDQLTSAIEAEKKIIELQDEINRQALGFGSQDIADSIMDGINEGLKLSDNGLGQFSDNFGSYIKKALQKSIIEGLNVKASEGFIKSYMDAMSDDKLTGGELSNLEKLYADLVKSGNDANDKLKPIFDKYADPTEATRQASAKGFATASQDSIDELNGRFTSIQGHTASLPDIASGIRQLQENSSQVLRHLAGIKENTDRLEAIEEGIGDIKDGIDTINLKGITLKR